MKARITEEKLMGFLYGELSQKDKVEVEEYLKENPDKQRELEEMGQLRKDLASLKDVENVDVPDLQELINQNEPGDTMYRKLAVAASVALIFSLSWIGYTSWSPKEVNDSQSNDQLTQILEHQNKLQEQNAVLIDRLAKLEGRVTEVSEDQKVQSSKLTSLKPANPEISRESIEEFMLTMREENKVWLDEYFSVASEQQQEYLQSVLIDFGDYMNEQRRQDYQMLQTRINNLEQNTDQFQTQATEIMAQLTDENITTQNY